MDDWYDVEAVKNGCVCNDAHLTDLERDGTMNSAEIQEIVNHLYDALREARKTQAAIALETRWKTPKAGYATRIREKYDDFCVSMAHLNEAWL